MTATPAPALTAAEAARVQAFDAAPYPVEVAEARKVLDAIVEGEQEIASGKRLVTLDAVMAEAAIVETVARAIYDSTTQESDAEIMKLAPVWDDNTEYIHRLYRRLAVAAIAAYRAAQDSATCGDLAPTIVQGPRLLCELPLGHGGAHQHDNGDGLPPTRWIAAQDGGAEEAVRRVKALHVPDGSQNPWCNHDGYSWPCPTVRAALATQAGDGTFVLCCDPGADVYPEPCPEHGTDNRR